MTNEEHIILLNDRGQRVGQAEKLWVHQQGLLHEAFSIMIMNTKGEMLLQKRAADKYHSAGLWTNACCSHPRYGERLEDAVQRRMQEELGFVCKVRKIDEFVYMFKDPVSGLIEHEWDHIFKGTYDGAVNFNPKEIAQVRWATISQIAEELSLQPDRFTYWFRVWWQQVSPKDILAILTAS